MLFVLWLVGLPKPPEVGKRMAQNLEKASILHAFWVQVGLTVEAQKLETQ